MYFARFKQVDEDRGQWSLVWWWHQALSGWLCWNPHPSFVWYRPTMMKAPPTWFFVDDDDDEWRDNKEIVFGQWSTMRQKSWQYLAGMASSIATIVSIGTLSALYVWAHHGTILSETSSLIEKVIIRYVWCPDDWSVNDNGGCTVKGRTVLNWSWV